jgi:hypothetical protein
MLSAVLLALAVTASLITAAALNWLHAIKVNTLNARSAVYNVVHWRQQGG